MPRQTAKLLLVDEQDRVLLIQAKDPRTGRELWHPVGDTYRFDGRVWEVHEDWLLHSVQHFEPAPAALSDVEARSVMGFRWWSASELMGTADTVFPARLGALFADLLRDGSPDVPVDITSRSLAANDPNSECPSLPLALERAYDCFSNWPTADQISG